MNICAGGVTYLFVLTIHNTLRFVEWKKSMKLGKAKEAIGPPSSSSWGKLPYAMTCKMYALSLTPNTNKLGAVSRIINSSVFHILGYSIYLDTTSLL
jgi:hypothetical protein